MTTDKPIYDASPAHLLEICRYIGDDEIPKSALQGDGGLDLSRNVINRSIQFGEKLGFLNKEDGAVSLTEYGRMLARAGEINESNAYLFELGFENYEFYPELTQCIFKKGRIESVDGKDCITQSTVIETLNEEYEFGFGERTLKGVTQTYLRTLQAAGFGSYRRGRNDRDTRVILTDNIVDKYDIEEEPAGQDQADLDEVQPESSNRSPEDDTRVKGPGVQYDGQLTLNVHVHIDENAPKKASEVKRFISELEEEINVE